MRQNLVAPTFNKHKFECFWKSACAMSWFTTKFFKLLTSLSNSKIHLQLVKWGDFFESWHILFKARFKQWTTQGVQNIWGYFCSTIVPASFILLALSVITQTTLFEPTIFTIPLELIEFKNIGPPLDDVIILIKGRLLVSDHPSEQIVNPFFFHVPFIGCNSLSICVFS